MTRSGELTYVVARLEPARWTLCEQGGREVLYQGPFWSTWSYGRELVARLDRAKLIAVNEAGRLVARERSRSGDDEVPRYRSGSFWP